MDKKETHQRRENGSDLKRKSKKKREKSSRTKKYRCRNEKKIKKNTVKAYGKKLVLLLKHF